MNITKEIIEKTNYSYSKLAKIININRFKISDYFNDKKKPTPEDEEKLKEFLKNLERRNVPLEERNKKVWLACNTKGHFGCLVTEKNKKIALDNNMKCPICGSFLILKSRSNNEKSN